MPTKNPCVSTAGSAVRSYLRKDIDGLALAVGHAQGDEAIVEQRGDMLVQRRQQDFANAQVVDQAIVVVGDIDDVQGLAVLAVCTNMVQHVLDGPLAF